MTLWKICLSRSNCCADLEFKCPDVGFKKGKHLWWENIKTRISVKYETNQTKNARFRREDNLPCSRFRILGRPLRGRRFSRLQGVARSSAASSGDLAEPLRKPRLGNLPPLSPREFVARPVRRAGRRRFCGSPRPFLSGSLGQRRSRQPSDVPRDTWRPFVCRLPQRRSLLLEAVPWIPRRVFCHPWQRAFDFSNCPWEG